MRAYTSPYLALVASTVLMAGCYDVTLKDYRGEKETLLSLDVVRESTR
jgi:hypothetical protein